MFDYMYIVPACPLLEAPLKVMDGKLSDTEPVNETAA